MVLRAQVYDMGLTGQQCESIVANAMSNPARADTLRRVRFCADAFGPVMAALLKRTDLVLGESKTYLGIAELASQFDEVEVLYAALAVAENKAAPAFARVASLAVVRSLVSGSGVEVFLMERFINYSGPGSGCSSPRSAERWKLGGEAPVEERDRQYALAVAQAIVASDAAPAVTYMASCIVNAMIPRIRNLGPADIPVFHSAVDFEWVRQCDRNFVLRNKSAAWVSVSLQWGSHEEDGKVWSMPPRPFGAPYSEATWTVPGTGSTAQVYYPAIWPSGGSGILMSQPPDPTPC
jgi:hypothetical protein